MAVPVKTLILQGLAQSVAAISAISTFRRNPPTPPKRETAIFPATFMYDDAESKVNNNRYSQNAFVVQFETYFMADDEDASDKADLIDSEIYKAVIAFPGSGVLSFLISVKPEGESSSSKQFVDEFTGVLISRYVVSYRHAYGDPTNPAVSA